MVQNKKNECLIEKGLTKKKSYIVADDILYAVFFLCLRES